MSLDYKVYQRPRGLKREMIAKFMSRTDAANYSHDRANTLAHTMDRLYTVTVVEAGYGGGVIHTVEATPAHWK